MSAILGDDLAGAREELRANAESLMVTPCVLERLTGHDIDPENRQRIGVWTELWSGGDSCSPGCRVVTSREAREMVIGGQRVTFKPTVISVPHDAPKARLGDRFTTSLGTVHVVAVERESWAIQQRYTCSENQENVEGP